MLLICRLRLTCATSSVKYWPPCSTMLRSCACLYVTSREKKKIAGYLYLLHELADFLHRGLFEFQQFGLLEKLLLHVDELALELLQSLPPLLAKPGRRWSLSDKKEEVKFVT